MKSVSIQKMAKNASWARIILNLFKTRMWYCYQTRKGLFLINMMSFPLFQSLCCLFMNSQLSHRLLFWASKKQTFFFMTVCLANMGLWLQIKQKLLLWGKKIIPLKMVAKWDIPFRFSCREMLSLLKGIFTIYFLCWENLVASKAFWLR